MLATLRRLRTLPPAQRELLRKKQLSGQFTPSVLIDLLRPLAEFDGLNDRARGKSGCLVVLIVIAVIVLLVAPDRLDWRALSAAGVLGAIGALLVAIEIRLSSLDISNNLRSIALPFLAVLREDMASDSRVSVRIDLRDSTIKAKKVRSLTPSSRAGYRKIVDTLYRDPWFSGACRLADGSNLRWQVVDSVLESKRSKRNPRGKIKTKTKHKKRSVLSAAIALPRANYALSTELSAENTRISSRSDSKRIHLKLQRKVKSRDKEPFDVRELIELISLAYRRAIPATQERNP